MAGYGDAADRCGRGGAQRRGRAGTGAKRREGGAWAILWVQPQEANPKGLFFTVYEIVQ